MDAYLAPGRLILHGNYEMMRLSTAIKWFGDMGMMRAQLAGVKSALKQGKTIHRDLSPADIKSLRADGYDVSQLSSAVGGSGAEL